MHSAGGGGDSVCSLTKCSPYRRKMPPKLLLLPMSIERLISRQVKAEEKGQGTRASGHLLLMPKLSTDGKQFESSRAEVN